MLIKYYQYKTNINFIYPTEDTVTNEGNKLNYYCNQLSSILIHFYNLSSDFTLWPEKIMSIILVCEIEIEIELPAQTLRRTETCQRCPATFINKIA